MKIVFQLQNLISSKRPFLLFSDIVKQIWKGFYNLFWKMHLLWNSSYNPVKTGLYSANFHSSNIKCGLCYMLASAVSYFYSNLQAILFNRSGMFSEVTSSVECLFFFSSEFITLEHLSFVAFSYLLVCSGYNIYANSRKKVLVFDTKLQNP